MPEQVFFGFIVGLCALVFGVAAFFMLVFHLPNYMRRQETRLEAIAKHLTGAEIAPVPPPLFYQSAFESHRQSQTETPFAHLPENTVRSPQRPTDHDIRTTAGQTGSSQAAGTPPPVKPGKSAWRVTGEKNKQPIRATVIAEDAKQARQIAEQNGILVLDVTKE